MGSYLAWNNALAAHFFCPDAADRPVYFFVTEDVINEVSRNIGQGTTGKGCDGFLAAVRSGPHGFTSAGHCQRALQIAEGWRDSGFEYPPYIAYLALFVLAGGHEGDYAPQAYYPRLWNLLGEERTGPLPSFDRMLELWDDLEQWAVSDRSGALGVFEARIVGGKIHIGLPMAQTILTGNEREALPLLYSEAELDPSRAATSHELRRALTVYGNAHLRPHTMRTLEHGSEAAREALLDAVAEDFSEWDGSVPTSTEDRSAGDRSEVRIFAGLRLCLEINRPARKIRTSLRVFARRDYPDEPLRIAGLTSETLECAEFYDGWSTPFKLPGSGSEYQPDQTGWKSGLTGADNRTGWRVRLEPARARVFVDGREWMLPGLVEVLELPRDAPFYIAFDETAADTVEEWLVSDCEGWQPIPINVGLPSGWSFGTAARASSDRGISDIRPGFAHIDRVSIRHIGGVHALRRNTYFSFAPPHLIISGASAQHRVKVAGRVVQPGSDSALIYELPSDLPVDRRIGIEVLSGEDVVRRSSLYLVSGIPWRFKDPLLTVDLFGRRSEDGNICGAIAASYPGEHCPQDLLRTPGLGRQTGRVYFVGRRRGEISVWPREPLPCWQAVWAVPLRRKGRAVFCGSSLADADPSSDRVGNRTSRKLWSDLLWRRRKQITPPMDRAQKSLWHCYVRAARER